MKSATKANPEAQGYLYRLSGTIRAICASCAREVIDRNPEMTSADWIVSTSYGTHPGDSCDACDFVPVAGEVI
jgi:hypothetical protein